MKFLRHWLTALFVLMFMAAPLHAAQYSEGKQYLRLSTPQPTSDPNKVEVVELFWYGCSHCFDLEPYIQQWLETKPNDVVFVRLPAIVGPGWELLAKAYYTADLLGVLDTMHPELFAAIHEKDQKIKDVDALRDFFVSHGVSADDFNNSFNSFAVSVKINNARLMTRRYVITGVPTVIVNGQFSTGGRQAGSNANIIKVVDYLVEQERAGMSAVAKTP